MVAVASVLCKFTLGPFSHFIDEKLIRDKVRFYMKQLEFPEEDSDECEQLSEDLQKKIRKFQPESTHQDLLQWLKSFDPDDKYNIRNVAGMIVTNAPLTFVNRFLKEILEEMEQTALDILSEAAVNQIDDENDDSD